jgi:pantoate--beta-alanine ligase
LQEAEKQIQSGEKDAAKIRAAALRVLDPAPLVRVEYLEIVDPDEMQPVSAVTRPVRVAGAVWLGTTRLIDNMSVGE